MAIKKLLLPIPGPVGAEAALQTALTVAQLWGAHLSVVHVRTDEARAQAVRKAFDAALAARGVAAGGPNPAGPITANFAWVTSREAEQVVYEARLSDLVVFPHPEAGEDPSSSDMLHAALFNSGRPVLIAPHEAASSIGKRICLGWNGTASPRPRSTC